MTQVHFKDMFAAFDKDLSGSLDPEELRSLVQKILPNFTEGQLSYFQVWCSSTQNLCAEYLETNHQVWCDPAQNL